MTLVEFLMGFATAMDSQRYNRMKTDHECKNSRPSLKSDLSIEKHASEVFTNEVFVEVQKELMAGSFRCYNEIMIETGGNIVYTIKDKDVVGDKFKVTYAVSTNFARCTCVKFLSTGIICRHIFHVLLCRDLSTIPSCLIMKRWRKTTDTIQPYNHVPDVQLSGGKSSEISSLIHEIWEEFRSAMKNADSDKGRLKNILDSIKQINDTSRVDDSGNTRGECFDSFIGIEQPAEVSIKVPTVARNKGCGKRLKSTREQITKKVKKPKRLCRACNQYARHDKRNCPTKNGIQIGNNVIEEDSDEGDDGQDSTDEDLN